MCDSQRRELLRRGSALGLFLLTPMAASLQACGRSTWPEGMVEIKWDRDTCTRCKMVISDHRFAAEARSPQGEVFKFDDVGCLAFWLKGQAWAKEARLWVADASVASSEASWLDATQANYVSGKRSPMGYNFAAQKLPQAGAFGLAEMFEHVLARGK